MAMKYIVRSLAVGLGLLLACNAFADKPVLGTGTFGRSEALHVAGGRPFAKIYKAISDWIARGDAAVARTLGPPGNPSVTEAHFLPNGQYVPRRDFRIRHVRPPGESGDWMGAGGSLGGE